MKTDKTNTYDLLAPALAVAAESKPVVERDSIKFTKRAKILGALAGIGLIGLGTVKTIDHVTPDFEGIKQVKINHDTVTELVHEHVPGGSNHTGATVDKIVEMNPEVFEDGKAFVESDDVGKTIDVPESVK